MPSPASSSAEHGYIEGAQRLANVAGRAWDRRELLAACQRSTLRNTGWPIGVVLQSEGNAPIPTSDGIEARVTLGGYAGGDDFWAARTDGSYYVSRSFEEDSVPAGELSSHPLDRLNPPERFLWFDVRLWRIAEVILHSAVFYKELGVPPDEPFTLAVNHNRLEGRELYVADRTRRLQRGRFCHESSVGWVREVTQDQILGDIKGLVREIADGLFVLFDFAEIDREVCDKIVADFLNRRIV